MACHKHKIRFLGCHYSTMFMNKPTKEQILSDFVGILNQIDQKSSDEIESNLQKIVHKIRPLIHQV